ncbi:MAG TPA: hypothetical protein VFE17_06570 [Candidatus Baltobacteraceae bacterium]|jgi:hypothetical protein|nr:hypothetical protein [Candidatus Baltobacteraceae bacterium]
MKLLRTFLAALLGVSMPLVSLAAPHTIAQLGTAPLLGEVTSTPQLQSDVARNQRIFSDAASKLGLTSRQYAQFSSRIANRQVSYVTIPRHLDAMSWASGGRVYVLHDVIIPAGTNGWEIDLVEHHQILAVFVPARCANLSILRKPLPALAQAVPVAPAPRVRVAAAETAPPASPAPPAAPVAPASNAVAVAAPAATPGPLASIASSSGPTHRVGWWPLLLVPLIGFLGSHGGNSVAPTLPIIAPPGTSAAGIPVPGPGGMRSVAPSPPPAGCPGPALKP